jgi:hypothetical protein
MMDELIKYFEEKLTLTPDDLLMPESDRMILTGQIDMLAQIKEINTNGFPPKDEEIEND